MWRAVNSDVTRNRDVEAAIGSQVRTDVSTRQGPVILVQEEYMRLAVFGIVLFVLIMGIVPMAFAFWFCVGLLLVVCTKAPLQLRIVSSRVRIVRTSHGQDSQGGYIESDGDMEGSSRGDVWVGAEVIRDNWQRGPTVQPLSLEEVRTLPTYTFLRHGRGRSGLKENSDGHPLAGSTSTVSSSVSKGPNQGASTLSIEKPQNIPHAASVASAGRGLIQSEPDNLPSCVVCLEAFKDGERVMPLPCMHQFHQNCIMPWFKQKGYRSTCPVCKTPCF
ncbi:hypothetical protein CEUSTIGMA_g1499.t1 [Chlamydomonas eustigma]|uniref:RING-type domain-containing protein n=1 Tax=Chlamydomonas eustigma TaxID=1157962 RepID=A0A250WTI6_9CHLO|nr:hypothetical protein CEUSTIGMA_g1499.t1 [Chlamydomonas eustigma]|eukprot:GAX74049.1 hypothetical protein CEUSTIGMA_g1499.t1 [Chlamydomonas eustigma]